MTYPLPDGMTNRGRLNIKPLPADRMVKYPFPIRDNGCCFLEVPRNITKQEVERISRYLMSLTVKIKED